MKSQGLYEDEKIQLISTGTVKSAMLGIVVKEGVEHLKKYAPWWLMCFNLQQKYGFDLDKLQQLLQLRREDLLKLLVNPSSRPNFKVVQDIFRLYHALQDRKNIMENEFTSFSGVREDLNFFDMKNTRGLSHPQRDKNFKALVVEDVEIVRDLHVRLLEGLGFDVLSAADGRAGLKLLSQRFDLALLDISLPDMNGLELAKVARAQPWHRHIKILAVTSSDLNERLNSAWVNGVLTKPILSSQLKDYCEDFFKL